MKTKLSSKDFAILNYAEQNGEVQAGDPAYHDGAPFPVERRDLLRLARDRLLKLKPQHAASDDSWEVTERGIETLQTRYDEVA